MVLPGLGVVSAFQAERAKAIQRLREAVAAHLFMMAGIGRYDTTVMNNFETRAFIKRALKMS